MMITISAIAVCVIASAIFFERLELKNYARTLGAPQSKIDSFNQSMYICLAVCVGTTLFACILPSSPSSMLTICVICFVVGFVVVKSDLNGGLAREKKLFERDVNFFKSLTEENLDEKEK